METESPFICGKILRHLTETQCGRLLDSDQDLESEGVKSKDTHKMDEPIAHSIWNPDEVYSRYIPCIYHVYSERLYIPGISQVYTMDIKILLSCIYGQFNAVNQSND